MHWATCIAEEAEVEQFYEDLQYLLELNTPKDVLFIVMDWNAKVESQEIPRVAGRFGLGVQNEAGQRLIEFLPWERTGHSKHLLLTRQEKTLHMDSTRWSTLKSEAPYSQQKQDRELTVARMMNLLPNSDWNWRKCRKTLDHSGMT